MIFQQPQSLPWRRVRKLTYTPAAVLFVSANIANAANLVFNMVFARLLGPELFADLALLLTLKLSILSVFSATQLAVSKNVAADAMPQAAQAQLVAGVSKLSFKLCIPLCLVLFISAEAIASLFALKNPTTIALLALALPALMPISLYRGTAFGRLDTPRIVASYQVEWIVRFVGAFLLWFAGLGLVGVTLALVASVYFGAVFASRSIDLYAFKERQSDTGSQLVRLAKLSSPFLAIQLAQILLLDGDLFIAKALLSPNQAGYIAALGLVQRIFFFAFLSFASLLLPIVARKANSGDYIGGRRALMRMLGALSVLACPALAIMTVFAAPVCDLLFGAQFSGMAPWAVYAALSAFSFTLLHLITTYFVAKGNSAAALVLAIVSLGIVVLLAGLTSHAPDLKTLVIAKFVLMVSATGIAITLVRIEARQNVA